MTPEPSTLEPFTADELDEMTARLGLGFTIETWNGPFPFGDKERHSVVFMTDDELRRLIAQARAARPSPWQDKHPTCGDCKFWEWEQFRQVGKMLEISETRDMGHCRCPGAITENERTPTEFYCPLVAPAPPAQDGGQS